MSNKNFNKEDIDLDNLFFSKSKEERERLLPEIVRYALSRGIKSAAKKYNAYPTTIRSWVEKYQSGGLDALKYDR